MKIALLMCGQLRSLDFCIESLEEYILSNPNHTYDIYICTQDCNCIKPRIDTGAVVNQYIVVPLTHNITGNLKSRFKTQLKFVKVRQTYKDYIVNQSNELILQDRIGWMDNFKELQICLEEMFKYEQENQIQYEFVIKTRPDILYCCKMNIPEKVAPNTMYTYDVNNTFIWDTVFGLDIEGARNMMKFYEFYSKYSTLFMKKTKEWRSEYNTEDHLYLFCKINKINVNDIGDIGFPLSWIIGDLKNCQANSLHNFKRHMKFSQKWKKKIFNYVSKCRQTVFDIHIS